jgi:phosphohistidine phosphatase
MIKDLYLLRHARAEEKIPEQQDIERILNSKGLQNATRMGMNFSQKKIQFDLILTSPAVRALATASLIAEQIKYDTGRIHENPEIYEASVRTLLRAVNQLKEEFSSVLLVGHNPAISYLSEYITKAEIGDMTTCGVSHIQFKKSTWEEISEGTGQLISYEYPDLLNF